jgi:quinoprotein glucose dehydrogenase
MRRTVPSIGVIAAVVLGWFVVNAGPPALTAQSPAPQASAASLAPDSKARGDWPLIGHDPGGLRHSPLTQLTPRNVGQLQLAWKYETQRSGDNAPAAAAPAPAGGQSAPVPRRGRASQITPLVVDGLMYITTPASRAVALEPETGKEIWSYEVPPNRGFTGLRSLAYWGGNGETRPAIFIGTTGGYLIALDAKTGKPVAGFGEGGALNLRPGVADRFPKASFGLSSPPVFYKNLVITGSHVQENPALGPSGDVRAWDARTGKLIWTFRTIPRVGEPGDNTWTGDSWRDRSGANVWGLMTVDVDRGLVFLPIGTVTADYYGGDRQGANLYGDTLVALDAATGSKKWHFQTTHHDIWDYDLNAAPVLVDVRRDGKVIPAVAQITKQSLLFIFDRLTGEPIHPVEERPVPQDGFLSSEHPWPTQPFPLITPPLARASFTPAEIAKITPEHQKYCEEMLRSDGGLRTGSLYLPSGERPAIMFPGTLGGSNWHGISADPTLGYVFASTMSLGEVFQMVREPDGPPRARRYKFWDAEKFWPCQQPPWGELSAVNVSTGKVVWRVPLGSFEALEKLGFPNAGTPVLGGTITTAGGVLFVGGTLDNRFRAFDSRTGRELWATNVGAAAHALPMTYLGRDGKQYVAVMVSGGGFLGDPVIPATLMVFAVPGPATNTPGH